MAPWQEEAAAPDSQTSDPPRLRLSIRPGKGRGMNSFREWRSDTENYVYLQIRVLDHHLHVFSYHRDFQKDPLYFVKCPRGLTENEFLDLLRSTFPQLGAHTSLELFTQRQNKRVPLTARTPEEIQEFMNSVDFISALFIQSKEQESVQSSHEDIEVIEDISPPDQTEPNSMDWEEPDNKERDDVVPIDDQDQVEEAPTEKPVSCTVVQMTQTSLKTLRVEAHLSCQICRTAYRSVNKLIKHSYSHMDDPGRLCGVCGHHSESAEELQSHLQKHKKAHIKEEQNRHILC